MYIHPNWHSPLDHRASRRGSDPFRLSGQQYAPLRPGLQRARRRARGPPYVPLVSNILFTSCTVLRNLQWHLYRSI